MPRLSSFPLVVLVEDSAMNLNKGGMIPKSVLGKNEQEQMEKTEKVLDVLRRQARIERLPTSQTGGE